MRIESVEAIAVDIPLRRNFGGSTHAVLKRSTVITRLRTDAGLASEVYNGDNREHGGRSPASSARSWCRGSAGRASSRAS